MMCWVGRLLEQAWSEPDDPPDPNQVRSVDDEPSGEIEAVIADWEQRAEAREREAKASMVDELISEHRADTKFSGS